MSRSGLRIAFIAIVGVALIAVAGSIAGPAATSADRISTNVPVVATNSEAPSPEVLEKRRFAEDLFGPELWLAEDATDFAEEPGWQRAVLAMAGLEPEFIVEHLDFSLNQHYDAVMKNPAAYRGRFVRMRGIVSREFGAKKLDTPVGGRGDVYRGRIADPDGDSARTYFDVLDPPPAFEAQHEAVDVDGVFYRTVKFEIDARQPGAVEFVEVPWIIARTVVPRNREPKTSATTTTIGLFLAFLALVGSFVYLVAGRRRRKAASGDGNARTEPVDRLREPPPKEPPGPPGPGV